MSCRNASHAGSWYTENGKKNSLFIAYMACSDYLGTFLIIFKCLYVRKYVPGNSVCALNDRGEK